MKIKFSLKQKVEEKLAQKVKSLGTRAFAKKIEGVFSPGNAVIACVLALASYIFVFSPSAHPTFSTVMMFSAFSSVCFFVMELVRKHTANPEKFNINALRLTILSIMIPLMLMRTVGMPSVFVFSTITFLLMSPLVYVIRSKWKISGHMCTFTAITTILSFVNGWFAALYLMLPVISWSRVRLKAHTEAQVLAGTLLGFLTPLTFAVLIPLV